MLAVGSVAVVASAFPGAPVERVNGVVFPGLQWNGKATQSIWHKNPHAKHGYAYYKVGQYTAFGGYEGARQGGVLFAGDHCSQDFQGFMEGAAREGGSSSPVVGRDRPNGRYPSR